jgi:hypothetical protein
MTLLSKRHLDAGDQRPDAAPHSGRPARPAPLETGALAQRTKRAVPGWAVLAVCCLAQLMVVLDISIVNVALPQMKSGLHLSADGQQWVINAYTLTFAGLLMLGGRAADLFGRRRVLLTSRPGRSRPHVGEQRLLARFLAAPTREMSW